LWWKLDLHSRRRSSREKHALENIYVVRAWGEGRLPTSSPGPSPRRSKWRIVGRRRSAILKIVEEKALRTRLGWLHTNENDQIQKINIFFKKLRSSILKLIPLVALSGIFSHPGFMFLEKFHSFPPPGHPFNTRPRVFGTQPNRFQDLFEWHERDFPWTLYGSYIT